MKKIFIAGHKGMVGSELYKQLKKNNKIIIINKKKLNLLNQEKVFKFLKKNKPQEVYIAAAVVGGINANNLYPAKFLYENLTISANLIHGSFKAGIKKILFLGSSCIYPKNSKLPIDEDSLLSGYLEKTNEGYAIAKIAGLKMCQFYNKQYKKIDYRAVMPCNLYGPRDNYDPNNGHVIPSLIYKFHDAKIKNKKSITLWGDGKPKREFLHVEDLAEACIFLMNLNKKKYYALKSKYEEHVNIGSGKEISILKLARLISHVVDFRGKIKFNNSYPNGTMRKVLNIKKIKKLGWSNKIKLEKGIRESYLYFLKNINIPYEKK